MDILWNALSSFAIELMSIVPKRSMADGLKPHVPMGTIVFLLRWSENPLLEEFIQMMRIRCVLDAVFAFHSVCSSTVLRFQMCISEEQPNQYFTLEVGEFQGMLVLLNCS